MFLEMHALPLLRSMSRRARRMPALALLVTLAGCTHHAVVHATLPSGAEPAHGVNVSGYGEARAAPDLARTQLGIEVRSATVEEAMAQANERMDAILTAVANAGVARSDLRTQNFSVSFEQEPVYPMPHAPAESAPLTRGKEKSGAPDAQVAQGPAPVARGWYRVSNVVQVTMRDLSKVGQVLKAAMDAGANTVWGISFELEDPQPLLAQAREKALANAKQSASELARLSGVTLGPIVAISESGSSGGPMPMMMKQMRESEQSVPVESGEITMSQTVQVLYSLPDAE